jgi:peptidyl-prolyl cis-trans isomerase SurA
MSKFFISCASLGLASLVCMAGVGHAQTLRPSKSLATPSAKAADTAVRNADYIVAIVNSEPITNNEVRTRVLRFEQQLSQRGGAMPPREELMRQMLERLINERTQVQLGREGGIRVEESALDAAVEGVARQNQITLVQLRKELETQGLSYSQFRNGLRDELMLTRVREREVEPRVRITEAELDAYIKEQQDSTDPNAVELNIAHILIAVPESASAAQIQALQARAERAATRARGGEDFTKLVREFSDAPDAPNGGLLGLRSPERYPELFVQGVQALNVGGVSGILRSGAGFHILKLADKRQSSLPGMSVVQSRASHILLRISPQMTESAARERLMELRRRIVGGQLDFATAARNNSQDGSGKDGGDLGWANPGQFVPEFEEVMNSLAPNELSQPLVSRFGVHLITLKERRSTTLDAKQQRELARGTLREKKVEEAFVTWAQEVRGRAYVELREPPR